MTDNNIDEVGPWVDVIFIQDWDETITEYLNEGGEDVIFGDWGNMAEFMARWDYGDETDGAHTEPVAPWGQRDTLIPVTVGGMNYILSANWDMRYASLNRRPLND